MALLTDGITHGWDIRTEDMHMERTYIQRGNHTRRRHIYTQRGHIRPPLLLPLLPH